MMEPMKEFDREKVVNRVLVTLVIAMLVFVVVLLILVADDCWNTGRLKIAGLYYVIPLIGGFMFIAILYFKLKIKTLIAKERWKEKELECKIRWEHELMILAKERLEMDLKRQEAEMLLNQRAKEMGLKD